MVLQADWAVTDLWSDPGLLRSEAIHEAVGLQDRMQIRQKPVA